MALSGVRGSWLTLETNCDLCSLAIWSWRFLSVQQRAGARRLQCRRHISMITFASERERNHSKLRHSSRNSPLKLSETPGSINAVPTRLLDPVTRAAPGQFLPMQQGDG
jgi:hypothetical protein